MKTHTGGDIIVEEIKVGDIHYEFEYGMCIKTEVLSLPKLNDELWEWQSKSMSNGRIIDYAVHIKYPHYAPKLYSYEAYSGCTML